MPRDTTPSLSCDEMEELLYDLGVLFVHGIGQSGEAATLLHFGEPLRQCISEITVAPNNRPVNVSISEALLRPEVGDGPARAELRINGLTPAGNRWLLTEVWWAKAFPTAD